jgi:hypothetical protein
MSGHVHFNSKAATLKGWRYITHSALYQCAPYCIFPAKNMTDILRTGQSVFTVPQQTPISISGFIARGGQGEVYCADLGGQPVAVKWYFSNYPHQAELHQRISDLVSLGAPSESFLWPFALVAAPGVPVFGYVMPFVGAPFTSLPAIWHSEPRPPQRVLAAVGMNLAHSFVQLHAKGLCYRDISDGNIFYHPVTGDIRIADNDNVGVKDRPGEVAGTRGYMAPEVVRREAVPSRTTDLHSLAVVLFQVLMLQHPLVGKRELEIPLHMSEENQIYFYGKAPVFIFDPADHSNELIPGHSDYADALAAWPVYPAFLRELFTRAFTEGLRDPENGRVTDGEWRRAFARLRDSIFYCPACGEENFLDEDAVRAAAGAMPPCRHCAAVPPIPPHIKFGSGRVMLNRDTQLFPHHVDSRRAYDFSRPVAAVTATPPPVLQNLSAQKWTLRTTEGGISEIPPGAAAPLPDRSTINFGSTEGVVRL